MTLKDTEQPTSAAHRVVDTLTALTSGDGSHSVRAIAEVTGNSRSATHRVLQSLADLGYAIQRYDGTYAIGPQLIELSARTFGSVPLLQIAAKAMSGLVDQVDETCYLATFYPGDQFVTYVHRIEGSHNIRHVQALGARIPLHAGAIGKAILAWSALDPSELTLDRYTDNTLTTVKDLTAELELIRAQGYATSQSERVEGVVGVAAPVLSGTTLVGGITLGIPTARTPPEGFEALGRLVGRTSQELSSALTALGAQHF